MALDDPDLPMTGLTPTPEELKDFMTLTVRQSRPDWEYSVLLPHGWVKQPEPGGITDVTQESSFVSLGLFTPTKDFMPPLVFSVGVRPAPKTGSVAEWYERQCYLQQLSLQRMTVHDFLFGKGIDGVALQAGDLGPMKLRVVMFEDGGRLFALTAMAPIKLWEVSVAPLSLAILTFELLNPKGQTAPLVPDLPPEQANGAG